MFKHLKYFIFTFLFLTSCQNMFHNEDGSYIALDTEQEKIDVLNGVYTLINHVHNHSYFSTCYRADDINYYGNFSVPDGCSRNGGNPMSEYIIDGIYKKLYTAIISANSIIKQTESHTYPAILGESYFLRAYCYLKLARLFGTPPIIKDTEINFTTAKPTFKEVYNFIESDLELAISLLPENIESARVPFETITKNAAKALLAEVYLAMAGYPVNDTEKYTNAAKLSGEVIKSGEYELLQDLAELWKEKNRHHRENIFGLFFNKEKSINSYSISNPNYNAISQTGIDNHYYNGNFSFSYYSSTCPEFLFYNNYPDNYRKYISFNTGHYNTVQLEGVDGSSLDVLKFEEFDPFENPCDYTRSAASLKHIDISNVNLSEDQFYIQLQSKVTLYLLRYAHTLLTYAEAKARIGELDASAYDAVNQVRRRANKIDVYNESEFDLNANLTETQFIDSVIWERAWELCFEPDGRWFDIIRLDLKDKLQEYRSDVDIVIKYGNLYVTDDWYFYKIPQHDILINPNLE